MSEGSRNAVPGRRARSSTRYASIGLGGLAAAILFHMCCMFDTPPGRHTLANVIGGVVSHSVWAGLFGWLSVRVAQGRRLTAAVVVTIINGIMTAGPTILILAGVLTYVGGWVSIFAGILFWVCWVVTLVLLIAASRTKERSTAGPSESPCTRMVGGSGSDS